MSRLLERAVVQTVVTGRDGTATVRALPRPKAVREVAARMRAWSAKPEMCQQCSTRQAFVIRSGRVLCTSCGQEEADTLSQAQRSAGRIPTRAGETNGRGLTGWPIVFNSKSVDLGGFVEIVKPEAMDRAIRENTDVRALWAHNTDEVIGRASAGTLLFWKEARGLAVDIDLPQWASRYQETVERGDVTQGSFGFFVVKDAWHMEDGMPHRELLDVDLLETSPVAWPAYVRTKIMAGSRWADRQRSVREAQDREMRLLAAR